MMGGRRTGIARFYGLREVATGIGLLTAADPTPWVWGRVGDDALDLASLVGGYGRGRLGKGNRIAALLTGALIGVLDVASARDMRPRR